MKYITNELLLISYVLNDFRLINLHCFYDVKFHVYSDMTKCSIYFRTVSKKDVEKIKYFSKCEKNFFNITYDDNFCCANFKVPKKYEHIVNSTIKAKINTLSTHMMNRFNRLQQQSLTARESSQAFLL